MNLMQKYHGGTWSWRLLSHKHWQIPLDQKRITVICLVLLAMLTQTAQKGFYTHFDCVAFSRVFTYKAKVFCYNAPEP